MSIGNKSIGETIKELREARGMTQAELAKKLNVKRETVNQWENNVRDLKTQYTISLAKEFDVSADYILGITPIVKTTDVTIKQICKITGLSEKTYETLCNAKRASYLNCDMTSSSYQCFLDMIEEDYYFRICVYLSNAINAIKRINSHRSEVRKNINKHIKRQIAKDCNYDGKHDSCIYMEFLDSEEQMEGNTQYQLWRLETGIRTIVKEYMDATINEDFIKYADFIKECINNGKHTGKTE